jgi:hypothetical protein
MECVFAADGNLVPRIEGQVAWKESPVCGEESGFQLLIMQEAAVVGEAYRGRISFELTDGIAAGSRASPPVSHGVEVSHPDIQGLQEVVRGWRFS